MSNFGWNFDNTYGSLPPQLFVRVAPTPVRQPRVAVLNFRLAESLGLRLQDQSLQEIAGWLSGNELIEGSDSLAQAYAGHQFGMFTMLGDGRAILLGEQRTPSGERFDIQLKGAGPTPYSRSGDGRAALGPMLREYLISEAMFAMGIRTTRSLAVVTTGEQVYRERPLPGAILTRVASSHLRVGTFEYLYARDDFPTLKRLADYAIARHYPHVAMASNPYLEFLRAVMDQQAKLVAQWQLVGFIHGVMNTDNMSIAGETIDYGPCAFMEAYDPATVFSSIDSRGRYAYGNQPAICQWNLARFAESLLMLIDSDQKRAIDKATELLESFPETFENYWLCGMRRKLGLTGEEPEDHDLATNLLENMERTKADFTNTFRDLATTSGFSTELAGDPMLQRWLGRWKVRRARHSPSQHPVDRTMLEANPHVIPRNQKVEEALAAATTDGDFGPFNRLLAVLESPYSDRQIDIEYRRPAPNSCGYRTFCGT